MVTALPASMIFTNPSRIGRVVFSLIALAVLLMGAMMVFDVAVHPGRRILDGAAGSLYGIVLLLGLGSTWLAMIPALRKGRVE